MALSLVSASSQYLQNTASLLTTTGPWTVGAWVNPASTGVNGTFFNLYAADNINGFSLGQNTSDAWSVGIGDNNFAAYVFNFPSGGTVTANQWTFVLVRAIAAANRRLSILHFGGDVVHAQDTATWGPAGITGMAIGRRDGTSPDRYFNGSIAEFWYASVDIQADGGQLSDQTVRELAWYGPLINPDIGSRVLEYRSFRSGMGSESDRIGDVWWGASQQTWTPAATPQFGAHPPLAPGFMRPKTPRLSLMV